MTVAPRQLVLSLCVLLLASSNTMMSASAFMLHAAPPTAAVTASKTAAAKATTLIARRNSRLAASNTEESTTDQSEYVAGLTPRPFNNATSEDGSSPAVNGNGASSTTTTTAADSTTTDTPNSNKDSLFEPATAESPKTVAATVSSQILAIDPAVVEISTVDTPARQLDSDMPTDLLQSLPFVSMFRGSANYIANHRNTCAVYHIPGGLLDLPDPNVFRDLMNDVALTWLLGMKVTIVVGCRHQIEKRVQDSNRHHGLRVTDEDTLRVVKEEAGYVRFEVERQLARSLRMQGGGHSATMTAQQGYYDGNVVSGNFYSAQPFGILDGVDYKFTGFVRRVEVEKIRQVHNSRDICLLTTLGVSPSGEVFNVNSESLAATVAGAMEASKVVYFTEKEMEMRHKQFGNKIQSFRLSDARNLLSYHDIAIQKRGFVEVGANGHGELPRDSVDLLNKIGWSIQAVVMGVKRAHIISPKHGALLQELYTRDGSGMLVSGDLYEGIRQAKPRDVSAIYDLISPLIQMGTIIDRPKAALEMDCEQYYVYTRDDHIVACGQLKLFKEGYAEIGCLVVSKDYRSHGRGDAMLGYLERLSLLNGCSSIFVLSTQTMEWFAERGFDRVGVERMPESRPYNSKRASKIYMKKIESARDLDASELWWNR